MFSIVVVVLFSLLAVVVGYVSQSVLWPNTFTARVYSPRFGFVAILVVGAFQKKNRPVPLNALKSCPSTHLVVFTGESIWAAIVGVQAGYFVVPKLTVDGDIQINRSHDRGTKRLKGGQANTCGPLC